MISMALQKTCFVLLILAGLICGCSSAKTVIILLPDESGKVGEVQISNKHGVRTIKSAYASVSVRGDKKPQQPVTVPEQEVREAFAAALVAEPLPPARYMLFFVWDSTELTKKSRAELPAIFSEIQKRTSTDISVSGHTDRCGVGDFNIGLSRRRAARVRDLLVAEGVAAESISVSSHGEDNPLVITADDVPEPRNRRVEVIIR